MKRNNWICERGATGRVTLVVDEDRDRTVEHSLGSGRQVIASETDTGVSLQKEPGRYEAEVLVTKVTLTKGSGGGYSFVRVLDVRSVDDESDPNSGEDQGSTDDSSPASQPGGVKRQSRTSPSDSSNPLSDPIRGSRNKDVDYRV